MKPHIVNLPLEGSSFWMERKRTGAAEFKWHYHMAYELMLFVSGSGRANIGDYTGDFSPGELYVVGPRVAHSFHTVPKVHYSPDPMVEWINIIVSDGAMERIRTSVREADELTPLLEGSLHGLKYIGPVVDRARDIIEKMEDDNFRSFILLMEVMELLANTQERDELSNGPFTPRPGATVDRLSLIYGFVQDNYHDLIKLSDIAGQVQISVPRLCAFFKDSTDKTLVQYINGVRVSHACRLLAETEETITNIAYEVGYKTISNFNRRFLDIKGVTPKDYRKQFRNV